MLERQSECALAGAAAAAGEAGMSWSVRGPGHKEGSACGCGRPGVPARSLDQAGEAAGVAEIELVLGVLPPWSLDFCKVGQKGWGRKLPGPGPLGDHNPWGGETGPLMLEGHWG